MKTTVKYAARFLPLLLILFLESGCTYALWTNGNLDAYKEPAPNPNLRLYKSTQGDDVLVVYKEFSERNDATHTRAYWLNKNQKRVEKRHAPAFTRSRSIQGLQAIPLFGATQTCEKYPQGAYAVYDPNVLSFTLYADGLETGSYALPVYNDHWGVVEKTALTPFAVSADVTIVGGCVAVLYAYSRAGANVPL